MLLSWPSQKRRIFNQAAHSVVKDSFFHKRKKLEGKHASSTLKDKRRALATFWRGLKQLTHFNPSIQVPIFVQWAHQSLHTSASTLIINSRVLSKVPKSQLFVQSNYFCLQQMLLMVAFLCINQWGHKLEQVIQHLAIKNMVNGVHVPN